MWLRSLPLVFVAGLAGPSRAADCAGGGCGGERRLEEGAPARKLPAGACDASAAAVGLAAPHISHNCLGKAEGEVCIAQCEGGYTISGFAAVLRCQGGSYSLLAGPLPTCVPHACQSSFPSGPGVSHDCAGASTGSSCTATCVLGYRHAAGSSDQTFVCQSDRSFLGTSPTCEAVGCTPLSLGAAYNTGGCGGKVTGQWCPVNCADGYELAGFAQLFECTAAGSFSGVPPTCTAKPCMGGLPTDMDLSTAGCGKLATGQSCSVACAEGYSGSPATFTCAASGLFVGQRPECSPIATTTDAAY